ncbi:MAG: tyrosine-type recombinase/integrase [Sandaracinus sp.]|nr:tyrosine-type recombinase/integrase [Sandaracinus sp.]
MVPALRRRIGIPNELVEVLRHHRREQLAGWRRQSSEGWVFPSRVGGLMQPSSARKPLAKAAAAAGLDVRPSSHWFRHTLNRLLRQVEAGVVQRAITGHVTDAMAEHYDHVTLAEKKAAVGRVLALVRPAVSLAVGPGSEVGPAVGPVPQNG